MCVLCPFYIWRFSLGSHPWNKSNNLLLSLMGLTEQASHSHNQVRFDGPFESTIYEENPKEQIFSQAPKRDSSIIWRS